MLHKILTTMAVAVVGLFILGGVASAAPGDETYPVDEPGTVEVSDDSVELGDDGTVDVQFSGDGFEPFEKIDIEVLGESGEIVVFHTTADSAGHFEFTVPLNETGTTTLTAKGVTSGTSLSHTVEVASAGGTGTGSGAGTGTGTGTKAVATTTVVAADGSSSTGGQDDLANTGASVAGPIAIGAAALFAGLTLLFFGTRGAVRRKRGQASR